MGAVAQVAGYASVAPPPDAVVFANGLLFAAALLLVVGALWFGVDWGSPSVTAALAFVYCMVATGA